MPYRGFRVCFYKKTGGDVDQFYYEPIVILDPNSIVLNRVSDQRFKLSFMVELWNAPLETRITNFLRKKRGLEQLDDSNVQVMPYEEIRLVRTEDDCKRDAFQVTSGPTSYLQLNENLKLFVFCHSKEVAELVTDPKNLANKLSVQLALVFKSPSTGQPDNSFHHGAAAGVKRVNHFRFNIVRETFVKDEQIIELGELKNEIKGINALQVF